MPENNKPATGPVLYTTDGLLTDATKPTPPDGHARADREETALIYNAPSLDDARIYLAEHDAAMRAELEQLRDLVSSPVGTWAEQQVATEKARAAALEASHD